MNRQRVMTITAPSATLTEALLRAGFVRDSSLRESTFRTEIEGADGAAYVLQIPFEERDGTMLLNGGAAYFKGTADSDVPAAIRQAAAERWDALRTRVEGAPPRVYSPDRDRKPSSPAPSRSVRTARNGSMVQDFGDMQRLGRDMKRVRTGQQLKDEGLVSDPIQH